MAKYASGITLKQQCKYEVAEMRQRLQKYGVPEKEIKEIGTMICEGYNQAIQANASSRVLESKLIEAMGRDAYLKFAAPLNTDGTLNQNGYLARLAQYRKNYAVLFLEGDEDMSAELAE